MRFKFWGESVLQKNLASLEQYGTRLDAQSGADRRCDGKRQRNRKTSNLLDNQLVVDW